MQTNFNEWRLEMNKKIALKHISFDTLTSIPDDNSDELLLLLLFVEFELFVEFLGPRGGILFRTLVRLFTVNVFALDGDT